MFERSRAYLRGLARRRQIRSEIEDELRFHLDRQIDAHVSRGMSAADAARQARLEFGGLDQNREAVEDVRAISARVCVARSSTGRPAVAEATGVFSDRRRHRRRVSRRTCRGLHGRRSGAAAAAADCGTCPHRRPGQSLPKSRRHHKLQRQRGGLHRVSPADRCL